MDHQGSPLVNQNSVLKPLVSPYSSQKWFWLSITDTNTVIMEFSYMVGVRELNPGGTLKSKNFIGMMNFSLVHYSMSGTL